MMGDGRSRHVTVSCSSHHEFLVRGLWNFLTTQHAVDFDFRLGSRTVTAHHLILQVFLPPDKLGQSLIDNTRQPQTANNEHFNDHLKSLVEFLYNGTVTVPEEELDALLEVATHLDFKMLMDSIASIRPGGQASTGNKGAISDRPRRKSKSQSLTCGINGISDRPRRKSKSQSLTCGINGSRTQSAVKRILSAKCSRSGHGRPTKKIKPTKPPPSSESPAQPEVLSAACIVGPSQKMTPEKKFQVYQRRTSSVQTLISASDERTSSIKSPNVASSAADRRKFRRSGRQVFTCQHCGLVCHCHKTYQIHMSRHDPNVTIYRCPKCPKIFLTAEPLEQHRPIHSDEPDTFDCAQCDYKSPRKDRYQVHLSRHDSSVSVFKCDNCHQPFFSKDKLEIHMARHKPYRCTHCDYETPKRHSLYGHLFSSHQLNRKGETVTMLECQECDYKCQKSRKRSDLKYHLAARHAGDRPHKCSLCSFSSGRKGDVGKHFNAVHLNLKPHLCERCGFRTVSQSALDQHARTHTGEKIYKCHACDKSYGDHSTLRRHNQLYHSSGGLKPAFVCHVCGNVFTRRHHLRRHLTNVHDMSGLDAPNTD